MRLIILFLLMSLGAMAQEPVYTPMRNNYQFRGVRVDSLFLVPKFQDTTGPNVNGNIIRVGTKFYFRDSTAGKWSQFGAGGGGTETDTTSLSNRIDQKVPYTGATQDVDLGGNGLNAKFIKITGTAGNGHIDLKHQSGNPSSQGNSSVLFADNNGYLKWKNDNLYFSTFKMPQTADRVYTFENKSYTIGDSAEIAGRVEYTDTASMLSPYLRKIDTASLSNRIDGKASSGITLQNVTDNGNQTTQDITANSYYLYDGANDNYGQINLGDNTLTFTNGSGQIISAEQGAFRIYDGSANAATILPSLSTSRNYTLPDRNGVFILDADTANMLSNYQRTTAFPIATFGAGSGATADTAVFTTSAIYGSFYNAGSDTIIVTQYVAVLQGTSPSITPTIYFNDSLNAVGGATKIVNSPSAVTSITTGNSVTSLDNTKIPPGNFLWVNTGTVTTKPTYFSLTLIGYRKR